MAVQKLVPRRARRAFGRGGHGRWLSPWYTDREVRLLKPEGVQCQVNVPRFIFAKAPERNTTVSQPHDFHMSVSSVLQ